MEHISDILMRAGLRQRDDITLRAFFKEAIAEAKEIAADRINPEVRLPPKIFHACSISASWFQKGRRRDGRYAYMDDAWVDSLPLDDLKMRLALFIADMYRQR